MPKWHTNGILESPLNLSAAPPIPLLAPLHTPTLPPPYANRDPNCAILAQFGVPNTLESRSGAGREQAGIAECFRQ